MALLPPPDIGAAYVDDKMRPSKDFYNWIRSLYDNVRNSSSRPVSFYDAGLDFDVPFDGSDGTVALQLAVDTAVADGKALFIPGNALVSDAIVASGPIDLVGDGRNTSGISVGDTNCTALVLQGTGSTLRDLGFNGSIDFAADKPTLIIKEDCNNCQIEHNFFQGGQYNILNKATDNTFFNNEVRYAYGSALVKGTMGSGNFWFRNKMDQVWPYAQPPDGYTINPRANSTAYSAGDVVTADGWRIQAASGGTSGSSFPGLNPYEMDIVDGSVHWQIVCPDGEFYSYQMDTGSSEVFVGMNDHSGCFISCVGMTNSGEFGSGAPFFLWIDNAIMGQHSGDGLHCGAGSRASISNSEIGVGWDGGNGVATELDWDNGLKVTDNLITGSASGFGVKLYGASDATIISDNLFQGNMNHAVKVDGGAGHIEDFQITDNVTGGNDISIDSDTDWFIVSHNNTHGGGVSNASGGGNFLVTDNL